MHSPFPVIELFPQEETTAWSGGFAAETIPTDPVAIVEGKRIITLINFGQPVARGPSTGLVWPTRVGRGDARKAMKWAPHRVAPSNSAQTRSLYQRIRLLRAPNTDLWNFPEPRKGGSSRPPVAWFRELLLLGCTVLTHMRGWSC